MQTKNIIALVIGAAVGYVAPRPQKQAKFEEKKTEVVSHKAATVDVAKNALKTIEVKKYYCPNGNLKKEVKIEAAVQTDRIQAVNNLTQATATSATQTTTSAPIYDWSVGTLMPPVGGDMADSSLQFGRRILGPIWVIGQIDVGAKHPMVGISLTF